MRNLLLSLLAGTAALACVSSGATAADLPVRQAPPIVAPVPLFTWSGFYIGLNAGAAFDSSDDDDGYPYYDPFFGANGFNNGFFGDDSDDSEVGFIGGGQVGFNYQFTPGSGFVIGIEADIQYADVGGGSNRNRYHNAFFNPAFYGYNGFDEDDGSDGYFGTVRGRLGYAFDRVLVYATGGFAFGDLGGNNRRHNPFGFGGNGFNNGFYGFGDDGDDTRTGYTVGGGIEYAVTNNITIKLEGLYVNLDDDGNDDDGLYNPFLFNTTSVFNPGFGFGFNNKKQETEFGVIRAGVNFKFSTF